MVRAVLRRRGQITLPPEVRKALHIEEGDDVAFEIDGDEVRVRGLKSVAADQAWFWGEDWQAGERQASAELDAGEGSVFDDGDAFLDSLT